jgi:hypothetical protein
MKNKRKEITEQVEADIQCSKSPYFLPPEIKRKNYIQFIVQLVHGKNFRGIPLWLIPVGPQVKCKTR